MGWLEGLLSGYANQQDEIRRDNAVKAEQGAQRESDVYKSLLNSEDPGIRSLAATGLLSASQPRKSKGGFSGWMGEMQSNPIYPQLMKYMSTPKQVGEDVTTTTTTPEQAGYKPTLPTPPSPTKPAAQTAVQTTTPGAPPPQAQQSLPQPTPPPTPPTFEPPASLAAEAPTPPPAPPAALAAAAPAAPDALPATSPTAGGPPPAVPQLGLDQLPGSLPQTKPESLTQTTHTPIMRLPHAFPTAEESAYRAAYAKDQAEFDQTVAAFRRAGDPNPEKRAADLLVASKQRAAGLPYQLEQVEWTDANGQTQTGWGSFNRGTGTGLLADGTPLPPGAHLMGKPGAVSNRPLNTYEEVGARLYGPGAPGEDIHHVVLNLKPGQRQIVKQRMDTEAAEAALLKANTVADANLSTVAKSNLEEKLAKDWDTAQKPLVEMRDGVQDMQAALSRFDADPNGASQAIITKFEKILNPTSMVRQQAYERTPTYLGLDQKIQGLWERYAGRVDAAGNWVSGGPGIPYAELKELAETARQFLVVQAQNNVGEQRRIEEKIRNNKLDEQAVFGNTINVPPQYGTQPPPNQPAAAQPRPPLAAPAAAVADPAEAAAAVASGKKMYQAPSGNIYINGRLATKP